jgi:MraZ protein
VAVSGLNGIRFRGEHRHALDAKSRVILPAKFREGLGSSFILTKGLDGCLFAFTAPAFYELEEKITALPITDEGARKIGRFFIGAANDCEFDAQGRIVLPPPLREYAGIVKEVVSVGLSKRVELWSRKEWDEYNANNKNIDKDLADKLALLGI